MGVMLWIVALCGLGAGVVWWVNMAQREADRKRQEMRDMVTGRGPKRRQDAVTGADGSDLAHRVSAPGSGAQMREDDADDQDGDLNTVPRYARICKTCSTINTTSNVMPGQTWIEVVLWFCYIVPGVIYSIWRRSKKNAVCSACASRDLVQVGTPVGVQLLTQYHPEKSVSNRGAIAASKPPPEWKLLKFLGWVLLAMFGLSFVIGLLGMGG